MEQGIRDPNINFPRHAHEALWVTSLVLDLEAQLRGEVPIEPITLERLAEWRQLRRELDKCVERIEKKY